jgi:UDP-N-acetylmuramoyl-tripeptide--D-alanyl-D-alanine ligase
VASAKAELVLSLPTTGTAILNADDERVAAMRSFTDASVVTVGAAAAADVRIESLMVDHLVRPAFRLRTPWGHVDVRLGVSGAHMAQNAAVALACVGVVGGDLAAAAAALARSELSAMRMAIIEAPSGATVIDDSYNANPTSMRAALDALAALPAERRFAVLGVMAEITDAAAEHQAIAAYAGLRDIQIVAVGTTQYGLEPVDDPVAALGSLSSGDAVLVKGSRVAGLERVAQVLCGS